MRKLFRSSAVFHGIAQYRAAALLLVTVVIIFLVFINAVNGASVKTDETSGIILEKAIISASVQCYAIEGFYPHEIDYLIDNYGLVVDTKKFLVTYYAFASNSIPEIKVFKLKGSR